MVAVMAVFVSAVVGFAQDEAAKAPEKKEAVKTGCVCCTGCKKLSDKAGKCCGKDMASCKILSIKDGTATTCSCAADCAKCGEIKDGKCACGKAVVTCKLTGKFVCEKCCMIANKAGKCACGADLVEVKAKAKEEVKKDEPKKEEAAK
jgi:hypothetical protein